MTKFDSPLNNIKIASPCSADWDAMYGDDRKRFCGDCKLHVYNLSGMTKADAESLITKAEGRLCVRFYKRADGTVITENCPVGWAKVKHRTKVFATAAFSMIMALLTGVFIVSLFAKQRPLMGDLRIPFTTPTPPPPPEHTMGAVALPPANRSTNTNSSTPKPNANTPTKFEIGKMKVMSPDRKDS